MNSSFDQISQNKKDAMDLLTKDELINIGVKSFVDIFSLVEKWGHVIPGTPYITLDSFNIKR